MMKRILVFMAVGVSFAPAAFAGTDLMSYRTCIAQVGESAPCQLENAVGATQCDRQKALNEYTQQIQAETRSSAGAAR
jgi:hypothetical protein